MRDAATEKPGPIGGRAWRAAFVAAQVVLAISAAQAAPLGAGASADRIALAGNVHPLATAANDLGPTTAALPMDPLVLLLDAGAAKRAALARLLAEQQDPRSPNFHRWLSPADVAARFGLADSQIAVVSAWLRAQGFTVHPLPRGRGWITFGGTAGSVNRAFQTEMHDYRVNGEVRHANATDPSLPRELAGLVTGVVALNDFRTYAGRHHRAAAAAAARARSPLAAAGALSRPDCFECGPNNHNLAPADVALIYDVSLLYSNGIDGTGQTLAVVGDSNIKLSDVTAFRSYFGLPATLPGGSPPAQIEPPTASCPDPGIAAAEDEGDLDVEWAGGIARNATVLFVPCGSANATDGVMLSAMRIVDENQASVLSLSFDKCEDAAGTTGSQAINALWSQAAAQGISVVVAAGDAGAASCDNPNTETTATYAATHGPAINAWCATGNEVCVGGTSFLDGANPATFWGSNTDPTQATALRYIPEQAWNESADNGGSGIWATGGGVSKVFGAPTWQQSLNLPGKMRGVPDVALTSAAHDDYLIVQEAADELVDGTSAATPTFAAMLALVGELVGRRQGNAGPALYQLAAEQQSGAIGQVFHDIKVGNNYVPPITGYSCQVGYDLVTGLGSVQAALLAGYWPDSFATLTADPTAGAAPLLTTLTAQAPLSTYGTTNYTFWWNCAANVATVAAATAQCGDPSDPAIGQQADGRSEVSFQATALYKTAGTFTPLVVVERNALTQTATAQVVVSGPSACTRFALAPQSAAPGSAAGTQKVVVTGVPAGCQGGAWTASGNGSWLTATPAAGSGSATVTVVWSANTGAAARSASATIAGLAFAVAQAGTTAVPPPAPVLLAPGLSSPPGPTLTTLTVAFFWQAVTGADSYEIELSQGGTVLATPTVAAPATEYTSPAPVGDNLTYQWRMRSHGAAGWGAFGGYYYFSTYTGQVAGDFALSASPTAAAVAPGAAAAFVIATTTTVGSPQTLSFVAGAAPAGVTPSFSSTSLASGSATTLTLAVGAGTAPGAYAVTVTATSAANIQHSLTVGLTVDPPPQSGQPAVCLTPPSLAFSDQMVGTSGPTQLVTLRNCGSGPLHVATIGASPDFFLGPGSIVAPLTLAAGGSTSFSVGFSPLASGTRTGSVRIASDAAGSPASLPLNGDATPAPLTTGTVNVAYTLNGQPFSGDAFFSVTGPGGTINFGSVPLTWTGQGAGSYTVAYLGDPPGGGTFAGISPAPTQTLAAGGGVLFTFAFTATDDFSFTCPATTQTGTTTLLIAPPGGSASLVLQAGNFVGGTQTVTLAVAGLPGDASGAFGPPQLVLAAGAGGTTTFTVTTAAATPPGVYQLIFSGTNQDGTTHTLIGDLVVLSAVTPQLVSIGADGMPANNATFDIATSADGRYVAFVSLASNTLAGDANANGDVFLRDLQTGTTSLVSLANDGTRGTEPSRWPAISADGRYVAFSSGSDLVTGGRLNGGDIYVRDLQLATTVRASVSSAGVPADAGCLYPSISGDGRYVAFSSAATNLVPGGGGGVLQIYVRDLQLGTTTLVSQTAPGTIGDANSTSPAISGDGQSVAFISAASNLVTGATAAGSQVFLRDLRAGTIDVVSAAPDGSAANNVVYLNPNDGERLAITPDGRFVAFASFATNLAPGDDNGNSDVFVWDRDTHQPTLASVSNDGSFLFGAGAPSLSADGRFVSFWAALPDGQVSQLALRDTLTQQTLLLSVGPGGVLANANTSQVALSANGRALAFSSVATNLVAGASNGQEQIYSLTVPAAGPVYAQALALTPAALQVGASATGTVTLSGAAPAAGASVALTSAALAVAVPPVVTVPAGSTTATFPITTLATAAPLPVAITAAYGGGSPAAILTLLTPVAARIDAVGGSGQTVTVGAPLPVALSARVVDGANTPIANVAVQFTAPAIGPSGTFAGGLATVLVATDATGIATAPAFTPGGPAGSVVVVATASGVTTPAVFNLVEVGLKFHTVPPCRVIDTRNAAGSLGGPALQPGAQRTFAIAGICGIPTTAHAVSANVTVVQPAGAGLLNLWAAGQGAPNASTISFSAGAIRANNAVVGLSTDGTGSFVVLDSSPGTSHFLFDVNGYFQ
jgi:pseudomonalisin